jgi:ipoprotein LpqH
VQIRLVALAVPLTAAAVTSGCGLTGTPPAEPPAQSGHVTIGGNTRDTQSVLCTRNDWTLTIKADAAPGRARAFMELGGERPIVRTVNIENINGASGVAGSGVGNAEATTDGNIYTLTGTAVGSDRANPGQSRTLPFEIKAPC